MFEVIDDGDNLISAEEFIYGFTRLKGPAKSIDMVQVLRLTRTIGDLLENIGDAMGIVRVTSTDWSSDPHIDHKWFCEPEHIDDKRSSDPEETNHMSSRYPEFNPPSKPHTLMLI
mmetsp:Transcript_5401/g.8350  ORF Transcript_5401/g.8350 Transcript_5401/m.8350 type:complete len:115 (+) Transcript_5401:1-345(+)